MKISVIDIGTNTFKLIIAESNQNDFDIILEEKRGVQLGKDSYINNKISESAIKRAELCLSEFIELSDQYNAGKPKAFATAAVRDAANGKEFINYLYQKTNLKIHLISGDREAELVSKGVLSSLEKIPARMLIMDIGGGSTEFIDVQNGKLSWIKSFSLGASRLLQELNPSDPVSEKDINRLYSFLENELKEIFTRFKDTHFMLVGSSGSFESIADITDLELLERSIVNHKKAKLLEYHNLNTVLDLLVNASRDQRFEFKGLPEYRVDTIVMASLAIKYIIMKLKPEKVLASFRALKEGIICELLNKY